VTKRLVRGTEPFRNAQKTAGPIAVCERPAVSKKKFSPLTAADALAFSFRPTEEAEAQPAAVAAEEEVQPAAAVGEPGTAAWMAALHSCCAPVPGRVALAEAG
jgi:hypothetical protein